MYILENTSNYLDTNKTRDHLFHYDAGKMVSVFMSFFGFYKWQLVFHKTCSHQAITVSRVQIR